MIFVVILKLILNDNVYLS